MSKSACTTVDRATFGTTRIGAGTKIDNQVQIALNCQIGRCNLIAALSGIAGSVTTGDYVIMGGQVGIADHSHVGDRTMLGLRRAAFMATCRPIRRCSARPATQASDQLRILMSLEKLRDAQDIRDLKKKLRLDKS